MLPSHCSGRTFPLLLPISERKEPTTRGAVHAIVKKVFETQQAGCASAAAGNVGRSLIASGRPAHWLRHTVGSHMANNALNLRHVRDNLGHESMGTTSHYLHADDDARHRETQERHQLGWS